MDRSSLSNLGLDMPLSDKKRSSHEHSSSKLTSRHESRKHGVKDGRIVKRGGLGWSSRSFTRQEENLSKENLLTPSYIYEENEPRPISPHVYEEVYENTQPKVQHEGNPTLEDEEKPTKDTQSVAARTPPERYNELSPLMAKMVEDELKNIMINVWQTLPDDASSEADKLVVDKFKNAAGDDLRNTIGLNVTKRLLNVHNGILVKVKIFPPVTPQDESKFAKKYDISEFKYVHKNTCAGRLQSWTDLDELFTAKNLKCDYSQVTVTPVYNFMKCPKNLRTIFDGNSDYSHAKAIENEAARKVKKSEGKAIVTADKVLAQKAKKEISTNKVLDTKPKEGKAESQKTESANKSTSEAAKNFVTVKKTVVKAVDKKSSITKQSETTNVVRKEVKPNDNKTEPKTTKVEPTKAVVNQPTVTTINKKIVTPKPNKVKKPEDKTGKVEANKTPVREPTKLVANKPSVATNSVKKGTITPKPNEGKNPEISSAKAAPTKTVSKEPAKTVAQEQTKSVSKEPAKMVAKEQAPPVSKELSKIVAKESAKMVSKEPANTVSKEPAKKPKEPAKIIAKESAKTVSKEPTTMVAKGTTKTVSKEPAPTVGKEPAKTVSKEPAKTVSKEPAKTVSKEPAKTVSKEPAKTVSKERAKMVSKAPAKTVSKAPAQMVANEPVKMGAKDPCKTVAKEPSKSFASKTVTTTPKKEIANLKSTETKKPDAKPMPAKTAARNNNKSNKVCAKAPKNIENDFDELNDHDILAMLSGGIVLDECSGSDEG